MDKKKLAIRIFLLAVSKWETGASYPDILLIAPISRALNTTLDTLLNYTKRLSNQRSAEYAKEVIETGRSKGGAAARRRFQELLSTYPEDPCLEFHLATVIPGLPTDTETEKREAHAKQKELLENVLKNDETQLHPSAAFLLAGLCLEDDETTRAQELLDSMPPQQPDTQVMRAAIFEKQGETEKAKGMLHLALIVATNKVLMCLSKLCGNAYCANDDEALAICDIHESVARLLGSPCAMTDALRAEAFLRMNEPERALESMLKAVETLGEEPMRWGGVLRRETEEAPTMAMTMQMRRYFGNMVYDRLQTDEGFLPYHEHETYQKIIVVLEQLMQQETDSD